MSAKARFPMPVERLLFHPEALTFGPAAFGMLTRLLIHHWMTGCRPLPAADYDLRSIARAHPPTWRKHREVIMRAFHDLAPDLARQHRTRLSRRANLRIANHASVAERKRKALMARVPGTPEYAARNPEALHGVNLMAPQKATDPHVSRRVPSKPTGYWRPV